MNLYVDGDVLRTTIDGKNFYFTARDVAEALGMGYDDAQSAFVPEVGDIDLRLITVAFAPDIPTGIHLRRAQLPPNLLFLDWVISNICYGHKDERKFNHLRCLYSLHLGTPINVPKVVFVEMNRFT